MNIIRYPLLLASLSALSLIGITTDALAHGYVTSPASRNFACKLGDNTNCGAIVWEPQSLEAPKGFPQAGPADGRLASAGLNQFSALDAQAAGRWAKQSMKSGPNTFNWQFTANHSSEGWRYFITHEDWDVSAPLTRASFDLQPFCTVDGDYVQPPKQVSHRCDVPSRSGYQVILAVWDIGDTSNAFYNMIDVMFAGNGSDPGDGGSPEVTWLDVGDINPSVSLHPGDLVRARVFDSQGENTGLEIRLTINDLATGQQEAWPFALAAKINAASSVLQAGRQVEDNRFEPVQGKNDVFVRSDSDIRRVEISVEKAGPVDEDDSNNNGDGFAGESYDFVYPEQIKSYKTGTRVLAGDGQIYTCKPFPYSGWCTIFAHQYTPGSGSNWQDAWVK